MTRTTYRTRTLAGAVALAALALAGCQTTSDTNAGTADPAAALTVADPWVKAADMGMTAAFGTLENHTDADIQIVAATTELSPMELHEMATDADGAMVMRRKEGGITVPANGTAVLAPGGEHLMLMDLSGPVQPGDEIEITLEAQDGTTWTFTAAARTFDGAQEDYVGDGEDMEGMEGMGDTEETSAP